MAKLSNRSSRNRRALSGVRSSKTSSAEEGIFHNSSQNSASSGETSREIREVRDSLNLILEADAPMVYILLCSLVGWFVFRYVLYAILAWSSLI